MPHTFNAVYAAFSKVSVCCFFKSECTLVNDVRTYSVGVVFQYDAPYISVKAATSVCIYTTRHRIMDCSIEHAFMNYTIKPGIVPMSGIKKAAAPRLCRSIFIG